VNELAELERGGELELIDAFEKRALAIAASAAAPNTRRAYASAYRMFAAFLRDRCSTRRRTSKCSRRCTRDPSASTRSTTSCARG
jgi:hypothetical protein